MAILFGHTRGAFTGANREREGLLRRADRGLLFLDEIGELGLDEQAMLLRAVEDKRFMPMGADHELDSDFQLIAGTNRDLQREVREGRFREDLLARINLWTFRLPGLAERRSDIEPNLDFELERYAREHDQMVRFNKEARDRYLAFAVSSQAEWRANFRDLTASITRMATLAPGGRITVEQVDDELQRLRSYWRSDTDNSNDDAIEALIPDHLDRFDEVQLREVIKGCQSSKTLSEAGRQLFAISRTRRKTANDADRLRKYLARFGLDWKRVCNCSSGYSE